MQHKLATLAFVGLTAFALSACSSTPTNTAAATKEPAKPAISEAAQKALTQAEADVKNAKAKYALWTTSQSALDAALAAAKDGNSDAVLKNAKFASEQAALGIAQLSYPTTELK